tara:strand:- start:2359 stop:2532 length:174 start_codon:yes stop_codon:yes gene_type:complete
MMINIKYNKFQISIAYSFTGKTKYYLIWNENFTELVTKKFRSIKKAKQYIDKILLND